jgi:hypothetical protein
VNLCKIWKAIEKLMHTYIISWKKIEVKIKPCVMRYIQTTTFKNLKRDKIKIKKIRATGALSFVPFVTNDMIQP